MSQLLTGLMLIACCPGVLLSQILDIRDLNARQIDGLDRERTVVILQGGILEEHGPYLPVYSDGWLNEYLTRRLAEAIVTRPDWKVVIFPVIPLGSGGANELAMRRSFPGTFAVRPATLRSVYMDLADELGAQRFRWVFLVNAHGAPSHSRALLDACDYYHDTYGLSMVHLFGLMPVAQWFQDAQRLWGEPERLENGFLVHADMLETSSTLYLRPSAVSASYLSGVSITAPNMLAILDAAGKPDWPGYVGAPKLAKTALGARAVSDLTDRVTAFCSALLDGKDITSIARFTDLVKDDPAQNKVDAAAARFDAEIEKRQNDWLKKRNR